MEQSTPGPLTYLLTGLVALGIIIGLLKLLMVNSYPHPNSSGSSSIVIVKQPEQCDDNNPCTDDYLDESTGDCYFKPRGFVVCDDGDLCTFTDTCFKFECRGVPNLCLDRVYCTDDSCDSKTGQCIHIARDYSCELIPACGLPSCRPNSPERDQRGCVYSGDETESCLKALSGRR